MTGIKSPEISADYSIFDIAGPIMVGPSSSHTGGACKLGQIARALFHGTPNKVTFVLHGSFATVYKGHATDRALIAGVMRFRTADLRIKDAFEYARKNKLEYVFKTANLGAKYHPNTVKITLEKKGRRPMSMIGSSIGGGVVRVVKIDQFDVSLHGVAGQYKTLVIWHDNKEKVLNPIKAQLVDWGARIHDIQTTKVGNYALSIINMDGKTLTLDKVLDLELLDGIEDVRHLTSLER